VQFSPPPQNGKPRHFSPPPQDSEQQSYFPPPGQPQFPPQFAPPPSVSPPVSENIGHAVTTPPSQPSQDEKSLPYYPGPPSVAFPTEKRKDADPPMSPRVFNTSQTFNMPGGAPPAGHFVGASATIDDVGTFNGGSYRISHRDTNTIVTIQLAMGCPLTARPGVMIAMSPSITLKGNFKFSMKKLIVRGEMAHSIYTGPGELILAPHMLGDVTNIRLLGSDLWTVGKESFLACTQGVTKDYKAQTISKAIFSGEGLFVYKIGGVGICWIQSLGAIIRKDVSCITNTWRCLRARLTDSGIAAPGRKIHH